MAKTHYGQTHPLVSLYRGWGAPTPILNRMTTQPLAAWHHFYLLRAAYTGPLIRVRRASDDAELDIGVAGPILDVAALVNHCGTSDGFVVTAYDQTGGAKPITQATLANQPQIWSGAKNDFVAYRLATSNGYNAFSGTAGGACPALYFDADYLSRADALGLTGNPALSVAYIARERTNGITWGIGDNAVGATKYVLGYTNSATIIACQDGTGFRTFTSPSIQAQARRVLFTRAAAANMNATVCRMDGVVLAQATAASSTPAIENELFVVGTSVDIGSAFPFAGTMQMLPMPFNADLSAGGAAADLAELEAWMQEAHYTPG